MNNFDKLLVANRGEIAGRIFRTARRMGLATVAVYSDADRGALHTRQADEAVWIGPSTPAQSYLSIDAVIGAARSSGAGAIHPGYGFLSENPALAEACSQAGIVWVGPSAEAMRRLGDKAQAKQWARSAGVPCLAGYDDAPQDDHTLKTRAQEIGFPLLIKATAGGGGRGMRRVERAEEFLEALASARAEAISAFGSGDVLLEPWVSVARHIEIQVLGDLHGHMVTLGERDCSVQRRHQKVVEEAPSPAVSAPLRLALEDAARRLALAASYANAGTVEFLVDDHDRFYFLEMNTRLQVEHPVTEEVTGIDLVELQLRVARGESLSALGPVIAQRGHSIEVRLYAEDPAQSFLPQTGIVQYWQPPAGDGVRVESGIESASIVSPYYDPMLAKIIATGANRDEARRRLLSAIERTILLGVGNNLTFLRSILSQEAFAQGDVTTSFLEESGLLRPVPIDDVGRSACLAAILCVERDARSVATEWKGWRSTGFAQTVVRLRSNKEVVDVQVEHRRNHYRVTRGSATMVVDVVEIGPHQLIWMEEGIRRSVPYAAQGNRVSLQLGTTATTWVDDTYAPPATIGSMGSGLIRSPTSGRVTRVLVQSGQKLAAGELVMVIEAMKMENHVCSPREGVVEELMAAPEDQVQGNQLLVKLVDILPKH